MKNYQQHFSKWTYLFLMGYLIFWTSSCSIFSPELVDLIETFEINTTLNTTFTIANGKSELKIKITALDKDQQKVGTENIKIYHNGDIVAEGVDMYIFTTSEEGCHVFEAEINGRYTESLEIKARPDKDYQIVELPIIFHLPDYLKDRNTGKRLQEWIDNVNESFAEKNQRVFPNQMAPNIRFRLAETDPNNHLLDSPGLNTYSDISSNGERFQEWMWDYYWHPDYYINVWIGKYEVGGAATYPFLEPDYEIPGLSYRRSTSVRSLQGIIVHENFLYYRQFNSRILQHELGHFFGLRHPHPCSENDFVDDTFSYSDEPGVLCNGLIQPSENYMSYEVDDSSRHHFTYSQVERMRFVITHGKWIGKRRVKINLPGIAEQQKVLTLPKVIKPAIPMSSRIIN